MMRIDRIRYMVNWDLVDNNAGRCRSPNDWIISDCLGATPGGQRKELPDANRPTPLRRGWFGVESTHRAYFADSLDLRNDLMDVKRVTGIYNSTALRFLRPIQGFGCRRE